MQNLEKGANNLEIRAIQSNEYDLFRQTVIDALFITESGIDRFTYLSHDMDLSTTRALFIDGSMVSALCLIPFEVTFGNAAMPKAGISMVTTPPERRKHGYYFPNRRVEAKLLPGFMARIVDVKKAFEMKQYAPDVVRKVVFDVKDPILPSNHDRFMLEVEGGRGRVKRTKKNAHFSCDINTLSQIFCGHLDLVQALQIGEILTSDIGKIATANRLFSELTPYMHDWF